MSSKNRLRGSEPIPHASLIALSICAAIITVVLKFAAYRVTGSIGLLSDAVESSVNVVAAFTALFALWYAAQPADHGHPYGHEKIEFFSSGIEGGLIIAAAGGIAFGAAKRMMNPVLPEEIMSGVGVALLAAGINYVVAQALLRTALRVDSIVLEADGRHLMADVWTSIGVAVGLVLAAWTRLAWIDPLLAILVAFNIIRIGWNLLRRSFDGLMDRALSEDELKHIRAAIEASLEEGMAYHALRTRRAGSRRFADYHLLVPGEFSVQRAHDVEMQIGNAVGIVVPGIEITSHIEPVEEPLAWNDSRLREKAPESTRK